MQLHRPSIMGILNATPDSFVSTSRVSSTAEAVAYAHKMVAAGATFLDIGGESTRPGAIPISAAEEIARVVPVIDAIHCAYPNLLLSIDTFKVDVAREAMAAGATIINDVHGTHSDVKMWELIRSSGAGYILMHSRGTAQTMDALVQYDDVVEEVLHALQTVANAMEAYGIGREQIMLDVGLGFAKTHEDSLRLLEATKRFSELPYAVLVGASRKRFLALLQNGEGTIEERSVAAATMAVTRGADVVRVHDVAATYRALKEIEHV